MQECCNSDRLLMNLYLNYLTQSVKNLVFLGKVLHRCGVAGVLQPEEEEEGGDSDGHRVRDLKWLVERLSRLARFEAAHHPKESIKVSE